MNLNLGLAAYKAEEYRDAIPPLEKEVAANPASIAMLVKSTPIVSSSQSAAWSVKRRASSVGTGIGPHPTLCAPLS